MKIIVIDDEKEIKALFLQWFEAELESGAVEFVFAFSAEEALQLIGQQENSGVVLILSDINMPGMSGLELLKVLKEQHKNLPVMMVTAYGDEANYNTAKAYGADGFIHKPVDFDALKEQIAKLKQMKQ